MSAPTTHDPLVVSTQDGMTWVRRAVQRDGHGLYVMDGTPQCCPEYVMATLAELAEHGLRGMADALPMPVGSEPSELERLRDRVTVLEQQLADAPLPVTLTAKVAEAPDALTALFAPTQALRLESDGCSRNVIDGDVGGHFFKRGAFADSPIRCVYCGAKRPESGGAQ